MKELPELKPGKGPDNDLQGQDSEQDPEIGDEEDPDRDQEQVENFQTNIHFLACFNILSNLIIATICFGNSFSEAMFCKALALEVKSVGLS